MHRSTLVFEYGTRERATVVERAVAIEAGDIGGDRTAVAVEREGRRLTVTVEADDLTALRAGGNTWCSLVEAAERAAAVAAQS